MCLAPTEGMSLLWGHGSPQITVASSWVVGYDFTTISLHISLLVSTGSDTSWAIMDVQELLELNWLIPKTSGHQWGLEESRLSLLALRLHARILREPHVSFRSLERICAAHCGSRMGGTPVATHSSVVSFFTLQLTKDSEFTAFPFHALPLLRHRILETLFLWCSFYRWVK